MSVVDNGLLFDETIADTDPVFTEFVSLSDARIGVTICVAPVGDDVSTVLQVQDPLGEWHTFTAPTATADGECDALVVPTNVGRVRAEITAAVGGGTARAWARAYGG